MSDQARRAEPIIVVSGFPRCGSSLMMRMLDHGGVPVHAQNATSYEHEDAMVTDSQHWGWLDACDGKAVKILEPLLIPPLPAPDGRNGPFYRFILLRRTSGEQARSFAKFMRWTGEPLDEARSLPVIARSFRDDWPKMRQMLEGLGAVLVVDFESIIHAPRLVAERVARFVGRDLDVDAMAAVVLSRSIRCLPDMRIEEENAALAFGKGGNGAVPQQGS